MFYVDLNYTWKIFCLYSRIPCFSRILPLPLLTFPIHQLRKM